MNEIKNIAKYTDKDWEELASFLSGEKVEQPDEISRFRDEDNYETEKHWKELEKMRDYKEINVDRAWNKVHTKINEAGLLSETFTDNNRFTLKAIIRIAAMVLIVIGLGSTALFLSKKGVIGHKISIAANSDQRNLEVPLPDGSKVYLNRSSELIYPSKFNKNGRKVSLKGEAFFEITSDALKPFIVDAGKASVKVLGTSFNIITNNSNNAVEVFVSTGKVMLSDNSGSRNLVLDPGYIGTMDSKQSGKSMNNNPNYMSWNTGLLIYDGQKLDVVFRDLKSVFNLEIIADDPSILDNKWTSPIDNQPQETIIRLICTSFNLSYKKDGNVYHLSKK
jgi:ferric-dicitrate binding protein FerR (iron transport regulator)